MINIFEFQGKSVEKALERASEELKIPTDKINHEVITYGSSGIFGLVGVKKAIIKVYVEKENIKEKTKEINSILSDEEIKKERDKILKILKYLSDEIKIEYHYDGEELSFKISGEQSGVIIGKRGQTLEAIQYIVEKIINKKREKRIRVVVDVEDYIEKRKINLIKLAHRMAEKSKKNKKAITIGQMNSHDRRIIHLQIKDVVGVRTKSIGDGYYRKLIIIPTNKKNKQTDK